MIEVATRTTGYGTFTQPGQYPVQLKYREYGGGATAQLRMEKASDFVVALDDNNNPSVELPDAFNKHGGYDRVGVPTNNVHLWGNGVVQDFDGGANGWGLLMRRHNTTVFYYVSGKIWEAYRNTDNGAPGWLGYPTSDPFEEGGVTRQNFEGGYITGDGQTATVYRYSSNSNGENSSKPNPNYIYKESDYLNALYQDNVGNIVSSEYDWPHKNRYSIDSTDGDADGNLHALVGGEVIEAKNGKEVASKSWGYNGTVAIYNKELDKTFIYWHLAEGSINESWKGKTIAAGDLIGKQGNTGTSYGAHTHVEVHNGRAYVDMSNPSAPQSPANSGRLYIPNVFQDAVRKGLVKLYQ
ncbi:peptidoglycan DD-metalloendopeptidase family protein [Microcoleus sp. LEGE 07076]|nr:peptidoglycan DD-metalloendopeptidase family protein [Microcoleus sp. LEGE 07076]